MVGQPGFFDVEERLRELLAKGDDLERIAVLVDFAMLLAELERAVPRSDGAKGGRPAFDHVLMFKILLLQAMHGLSDERCEYLIKDRLSFMRFLGLGLADPVPDANTIWAFREALKRTGAVERLFAQFDAALRAAGYLAMGGQIVDATRHSRFPLQLKRDITERETDCAVLRRPDYPNFAAFLGEARALRRAVGTGRRSPERSHPQPQARGVPGDRPFSWISGL